jgi:hypothetical protein
VLSHSKSNDRSSRCPKIPLKCSGQSSIPHRHVRPKKKSPARGGASSLVRNGTAGELERRALDFTGATDARLANEKAPRRSGPSHVPQFGMGHRWRGGRPGEMLSRASSLVYDHIAPSRSALMGRGLPGAFCTGHHSSSKSSQRSRFRRSRPAPARSSSGETEKINHLWTLRFSADDLPRFETSSYSTA